MGGTDPRLAGPYQNLRTADVRHGRGVLVGSFTALPSRPVAVRMLNLRTLPHPGDRRYLTLRGNSCLTGAHPQGGVRYLIKRIQLSAAVDGAFGETRG